VSRQVDAGGEAVVLARLAAGDERALAMVYDQHADMVYGLARRVTRDDHLAREITQEVFTFLWEQPQRVDLERGSLRAFLGVVTHHRAVDEVRRVTRRSEAEARAHRGEAIDDGHEGAVLEAAAQDWRRERLAGMLDQLPADQRAALELAYFDGRTYREVATILGIPEGTAKSRLRLALARLRTMIGPENARAWT
jgi:RNA polymerase sigma-70 factor (ECF subfamily)